MKTLAFALGLLAAMVAVSWGAADSATPSGKSAKTSAAAKVVLDVLQREARQSVADRAELLKPALELVPNHEAAMWLSGFIFDAGQKQWLRYDEVPPALKSNDRLAAYRANRAKYPDTVDAHLELANWCLKKNLTEQARAHLTKVLDFNPDHPQARHLLGYRFVAG
ncbi:MAG TPA: tetratricopeptide repeat protein, partial [Thermoguttaceae bacterium]